MSHEQMLYDCGQAAIKSFGSIARTFDAPPESFLVSSCMVGIHERFPEWSIRPELPARECTNWGIPRNDPTSPLNGSFRIDLACFRSAERTATDVTLLVEFKLWTDRYEVERDLARLRALLSAISSLQPATPAEAYVVCCPHYPTTERVQAAIDYFSELFKFKTRPPFPTSDLNDAASAAVIVIDAMDLLNKRDS